MRWLNLSACCLAFGLWLFPPIVVSSVAVRAADAKATTDDHGHAQEEFSIFPKKYDLGIWSLIVFVLLFFVLKKYAWGPIQDGLHKREASIEAAIEESKKARAEAEAMRNQLQGEMANAHLKVKELMDEARRDAERVKAEIVAQGKAELTTERERLNREIQTQTDQALQSLWTKTAELATLVSGKALRKQLDVTAHRRLIDEALQDVKNAEATNGHA